MKIKLSPSIMCVDMMNVAKEIRELESAGVDFFHVDIMDNHFVPNITLGYDFIKELKKITKVPLDIHLMIEYPEQFLEYLDVLDSDDIITIHYESTPHINRVLEKIKSMGVKSGIALNPATNIEVLKYIVDKVDIVLIMTVDPGFAGQKLVYSTLEKIKDTRVYLNERNRTDILIEVDGNVSFENAPLMYKMGADIFVGGSSSVFDPCDSIENNCLKMRKLIQIEKRTQ